MALAGGRAILMELAHPAIAQAVADFDQFREDPARRARLTAMAFRDAIHGTEAEAVAVGDRLRRVHDRVRGPTYAATDPALILWVHATFVDSLVFFGERLHGRLSAGELAEFYRHAMLLGELFGCPLALQPGTIGDFRTYVATTTAALEVSDVGRQLARAVFWPPVPTSRAPVVGLYRSASFGSLPPRLREQYRWKAPEAQLFEAGRLLAPVVASITDRLFFAVADGNGRGVRTALALAGISSASARHTERATGRTTTE